MSDPEDILQKYIDALENGASLEQILAEIPDDQKEIEPLLRLAAAMRETEHPQHRPERIRNDQMALRAELKGSIKATRSKRAGFQLVSLPGFIGVLGLIFLFAVISFGAMIFLQGPRGAKAATLTGVNGLVEVSSERTGNDWRMVEGGDRVGEGAIVRTDASSTATLIFYDGSRVVLDANTTVYLESVEGMWNREMRIAIDQAAGKTYHSVVPITSNRGKYEVHTPSAIASAKGTKFVVGVENNGRTRVSVRSGQVSLTKNSSVIQLQAGQALTATPDGNLENPAYQFSIHGLFDLNESEESSVSGMKIEVSEKTSVSGNPTVGDYVDVEGRILDSGEWVADEIELADEEEIELTFSGVVNDLGDITWQIGDSRIEIDENTLISEGVSDGTIVDVTFIILEDGRHLATKIEAIEVAPNPTALPSLSFPVEEMEIPGCDSQLSIPVTLRNDASGESDFAAGVELGFTMETGEEFVKMVELVPTSWPHIAPGETVEFMVNFVLDDWAATSEDTEVKIRVFVAEETNRPDHLNGRLTITLISTCESVPYPAYPGVDEPLPTETSTPTQTFTPTQTITPTEPLTATETITPTATLPATETITPTESTATVDMCTGAEPHPTAVKLSRTYGVSEEEIMGWFCQGIGFGEIDLAYSLSQQTIDEETGAPIEVDVAVIFEMRQNGMGWGEIKEAILDNPSNNSKAKAKTPNANKPEKTKEKKDQP